MPAHASLCTYLALCHFLPYFVAESQSGSSPLAQPTSLQMHPVAITPSVASQMSAAGDGASPLLATGAEALPLLLAGIILVVVSIVVRKRSERHV
ncbi:MAG: hypothetical protein KDC95_20965 [Planctomycetes bacterium]|nr:hypothetical protein [Planctomycetota bacterium]